MKAILFDLDGTLLDTLEDLYNSINFALDTLSLPLRNRKEVRSYLGNGAANLIRRSLPDGDTEHFEEAYSIFHEHYAIHSYDTTRPYDGIPEALASWRKQGYALAIISNKPDSAVQILGERFFPDITFTVGEREGISRKPAPDALLEAMHALGVKKEDCIYVGDSEVDVETARNAGIPCVAVTWGFRDRDELVEAGATVFADTTADLVKRVSELLG
ncbi:MAG: HAD-IA family hydrolase [Clostridia bacterium]|nr:HAD-IA family hydrolase [Clostridia bacterium]